MSQTYQPQTDCIMTHEENETRFFKQFLSVFSELFSKLKNVILRKNTTKIHNKNDFSKTLFEKCGNEIKYSLVFMEKDASQIWWYYKLPY